MADRFVPDSSAPSPLGQEYLDTVSQKFGMLFDAVALRQTSISNSGNDYTITIDPVLNDDVLPGMSFYISPNASNTGNVRLRITSDNPYYPIVKADGSNLASGDFAAGSIFQVVFISGEFKVISTIGNTNAAGINFYFSFISSGVLDLEPIKAILSPDRMVTVEVWAGGAGGNFNCGGGGGAFKTKRFRLGDLPDVIPITVGNGGAVSSAGQTSSFSTLCIAYHGGSPGSGGGGGGGGAAGPGGNGGASSGGTAGSCGGGSGGGLGFGGDSASFGEGGGGGAGAPDGVGGTGGRGGNSMWGGGGGGGRNSSGTGGGAGGISGAGGGNGGAFNQPGQIPGGGGGANAAGARGQINVYI